MKMKNAQGQAITADAYQEFILNTVKEHDGVILEELLDDIIIEAYQKHWGPTDLAPWGSQKHPKWKQNVASAKSGLDRRGIVVRFEYSEAVPLKEAPPGGRIVRRHGKPCRLVKRVCRVLLPKQIYGEAYCQWKFRKASRPKRAYEKLMQPTPVYVVPK